MKPGNQPGAPKPGYGANSDRTRSVLKDERRTLSTAASLTLEKLFCCPLLAADNKAVDIVG